MADETTPSLRHDDERGPEAENETLQPTSISSRQKTTDTQAVIHLVKSSLGTGILAMPFAFSYAGLVGGMLGTAFVSFVYTYCVHIMVKSAHVLCHRYDIPSLDFASLVDTAFQRGPQRVHRFAGPVRVTVQFFLVAMTLSACSVYTVFIAESLTQVTDVWFLYTVNLRLAILVITLVLLALCMVRGLRYIAPFSLISNLLILAAVAVVLSFVFAEPLPSVTERPALAPITSLPIFLSTATFAISGITVVMPLENSMQNPSHFLGCGRVLTTAMTLIAAAYAALGFFGFLKYGPDVEASISLNLPPDSELAQAANLMLGLAVTLTYPLVMQCCVEFTWPGLSRKLGNFVTRSPVLSERLYRASLVIALSLVAALVPNLGALISLSGALFTCSTAFLLPPVLESVVQWESLGRGSLIWTMVKNAIIVLFGFTVAVTGTITSIQNIIEAFSKST